MVVDYPGLAEEADRICETAPAGPGFYHADELETSIVLALEPAAVRMDRAVAEYPAFPAVYGATPVSLRDVSRSGVFGDPLLASAEKGHLLLEALVARATVLLEAFLDHIGGVAVTAPPPSPGP